MPAGLIVPLTFSQTTGGNAVGNVATLFPTLSLTERVRVSVLYNDCANAGPGEANLLVSAQPCDADQYTFYLVMCNGADFYMEHVAQAKGLC